MYNKPSFHLLQGHYVSFQNVCLQESVICQSNNGYTTLVGNTKKKQSDLAKSDVTNWHARGAQLEIKGNIASSLWTSPLQWTCHDSRKQFLCFSRGALTWGSCSAVDILAKDRLAASNPLLRCCSCVTSYLPVRELQLKVASFQFDKPNKQIIGQSNSASKRNKIIDNTKQHQTNRLQRY